jgi:hypothetical protein
VPEYQWSRVLEPLLTYCRAPQRAADSADAGRASVAGVQVVPPPWEGVRGDLDLLRGYLREGGARLLLQKLGSRAGRLVRGQLRARR